MNGSKSPAPTTRSAGSGDASNNATATTKERDSTTGEEENPDPSAETSVQNVDIELPDAPPQSSPADKAAANGANEDADSEAETLIDSPEKKKAAQGNPTTVKQEKPQKSRIGSLPVPQDDDDDVDSTASPMQSVEGKGSANGDAKEEDADMLDEEDAEGSDDLSSAHSSPSRESSRSRAASENARDARNGAGSPNPRKRKHRASSVEMRSSKRRSTDPPARRQLRNMHSEDIPTSKTDRSPSPKSRGHRRAVSTQSALDGTVEAGSRKRRTNQFPVREPKSAKSLEESDASSETTSRGHDEFKRPQRGMARSTSTPGRPGGREHKRPINKYGFSKLAEACEENDLELVKEWRQKDPDTLELAEFAGNKPLQIAALNGNADVVAYLISEGAQTDCANVDKDTPLIDAAENGHIEVVKLLLDAGVDPLRQNKKGQQALDVVTEDPQQKDEAKQIRKALHEAIDAWNSSSAKQRRREEEEENRHRAGPSKELHFMARTYENLLKLVQNNDRNGVQEFLAARVPVDNAVIAAAAKTGDLYLVNMLLAEMSEKKMFQKSEKVVLSVLGTSHFEMLKALTELELFNPLWRSRVGKSWSELAEERKGPMWRQEKELLSRLLEKAQGEGAGKEGRRSSSPVGGKREGGGRRRLGAKRVEDDEHDEESEVDDEGTAVPSTAKKRNGRRLMSRKALRTAKGGSALSDSDEHNSGEDAPGEAENEVVEEALPQKEPETPNTRRRLRSKSQSGSPEITPKNLRKNRSSSFRSNNAPPTSEAKGLGLGLSTVPEESKVITNTTKSSAEEAKEQEEARENREAEAANALALVQQAEARRKEEEAAEAEAKRIEQETQRQADEEKRAEEERQAEEARKHEEIRAEQARKEEEERVRVEKEREEKRRVYRQSVLEGLPGAVREVLDPESAFLFEGLRDKSWLVEWFTPLHVLSSEGDDEIWVLNLQAAPLLGKSGLELFFNKQNCPDFEESLASRWGTAELSLSDWQEVESVLLHLPLHAPGLEDERTDYDEGDKDRSFQEDLKRAAERWNAFVSAKQQLGQPECRAMLQRIKLSDVLAHLHPLLRDTKLDLEFSSTPAQKRGEVTKELETKQAVGFVERMRAFWDKMRGPCSVSSIDDVASLSTTHRTTVARVSNVVVVHEK